MGHVVLLGDSIFDNRAYIGGDEPDVVEQLRERLPAGWKASLCAVDGSMTTDVHKQLAAMPPGATHLIVSVGGNDAINRSNILNESASSTAEVLSKLADIGQEFQRSYHEMLEDVLKRDLPTAVCTIYYPCFPEASLQRIGVTALTVFNDCIIREAFAARLPLIDLRLICDEETDYANPIEPSAKGGGKISDAIVRAVTESDFEKGRTEVFI